MIKQFWTNEDGQDLIEYTLLLAFITLGSAALMSKAGGSANTIWTAASTTLSNAAVKAAAS
jgi:Flp pilus assembly pilin Flp